MSDHVDGPRQIGDPSADITDLLAFTSPENPTRTVLAVNVFPTCGVAAIFSNAINHSIVVRRAKVVGVGDATKFETSDPEVRFSCQFDGLERGAADGKPVQRGTFTFPDGQTLRFLVGDEKGASTPDGHIFGMVDRLDEQKLIAGGLARPKAVDRDHGIKSAHAAYRKPGKRRTLRRGMRSKDHR